MVLEREEGRATFSGVEFPFRLTRHETLAVLNPAGFDAPVRIPLGKNIQLQYLKVRTIDPDGSVIEVTPEQVREEKSTASFQGQEIEVVTKIFRFPSVKAGSRIEYAFAIDSRTQWILETKRIMGELPIAHYHAEISVPVTKAFALRLHHSPGTRIAEREDAKYRFISFDLYDLPAASKEPFAAPWRLVEPWWAFRSTQRELGRLRVNQYTWAQVEFFDAGWLYHEGRTWAKDIPIRLAADCDQDRRCRLERVLAFVRDRAKLRGFTDGLRRRPLKEVLSTGEADNIEKAMLVWAALNQVGVDSHFALVSRDPGLQFEHDFPLPGQYDHVILRVPWQHGIVGSIFVDPSCEACTPGQIPAWIEGREALVLRDRSEGNEIVYETEFERVTGEPGPASLTRALIEVQLKASGDASGSFTVERSGADAVESQIQTATWQRERWRESITKAVTERVPNARVGLIVPQVCDRGHAACRLVASWSAPSYATEDGDRIAVPLTWLGAFERTNRPPDPRRATVFIPRSTRVDERIFFHLPPGYVAGDLPKAVSLQSSVADITLEVESRPGEVSFRRSLVFHAGEYPPDAWASFDADLESYVAMRRMLFTVQKALVRDH